LKEASTADLAKAHSILTEDFYEENF
jgi:hypothetical protein